MTTTDQTTLDTSTADIEQQMMDLLDAALKEQMEQDVLIDQMRRDLSHAQTHSIALGSEAQRIAKSLLMLRGNERPNAGALIDDRRAVLARGAD